NELDLDAIKIDKVEYVKGYKDSIGKSLPGLRPTSITLNTTSTIDTSIQPKKGFTGYVSLKIVITVPKDGGYKDKDIELK
ncbi:MAG: hypothetical protein ACPGJS_22385, partial [Flammeovirgaceae bacterium]